MTNTVITSGRVYRKCWKCKHEWNVSRIEPFDPYDKYICPTCEKNQILKERLKKGRNQDA